MLSEGLNTILNEKYWCIPPLCEIFYKKFTTRQKLTTSFRGIPWGVLQLCICLAVHGLVCFWAHLWHLEACPCSIYLSIYCAPQTCLAIHVYSVGPFAKPGWWHWLCVLHSYCTEVLYFTSEKYLLDVECWVSYRDVSLPESETIVQESTNNGDEHSTWTCSLFLRKNKSVDEFDELTSFCVSHYLSSDWFISL